MFIPGFSPETMSDEELLARYNDISAKLVYYASAGSSAEIIDQLRIMQSVVVMEQTERMQREMFKQRMKDQKAVVETEPDLSPEQHKSKPGERVERKPMQRMQVMRSKQPSNLIPSETPPTPPKDSE